MWNSFHVQSIAKFISSVHLQYSAMLVRLVAAVSDFSSLHIFSISTLLHRKNYRTYVKSFFPVIQMNNYLSLRLPQSVQFFPTKQHTQHELRIC